LAIETAARSCLITGASTGIGEACALRLDAAGWRVFAGVRRDDDAARLRSQLSERSHPVIVDVTDRTSIARAVDDITSVLRDDGLSGLVNNAGIAVSGPLEFLPVEEFRRQLDVNVSGQLAVTQACLSRLRSRRGRIVFMGSIAGRVALPMLGPYSASKHALEALADALRLELQPWGMHVSIVEPGSVATPIWKKGEEMATRASARFPPAAEQLYSGALQAFRNAAADAARRGIAPDNVAIVVEHALTSAQPRTRYLIGADAKLRARISALIPDRLRDRLFTRALGLPARDSVTGAGR
jgi:NAD(P)-dependent dehydrogenase (short-subunit alcohol dehydrogenase family)